MTVNAPINIVPKYYVGQTVFVILYPTVEIRPVEIQRIFVNTTTSAIKYSVLVKDDVLTRSFTDTDEADLYLWDDAKAKLLAYLTLKLDTVNNLTAPA